MQIGQLMDIFYYNTNGCANQHVYIKKVVMTVTDKKYCSLCKKVHFLNDEKGKQMKRFLCGVCAASLSIALISCNAGTPGDVSSKSSSIASSSAVTTPTDNEGAESSSNESQTKAIPVEVSAVYQTTIGDEIWYQVLYELEGNDEKSEGYMNPSGEVFATEPKGTYENITSSLSYVLYDGKGSEVYSSQAGEGWLFILKGTNDGVYLAEKIVSGLDEAATYIGLIDNNGNWMANSSVNLTELTGARQPIAVFEAYDLGEGMLAAYYQADHGNCLLVFDKENGSNFAVQNVWPNNLQFYNGTMVFQEWGGGTSGGHLGGIYSVDKSGTVTELPVQGNLLAAGPNGFLTNANNLSFYTRSGELVWSFNDYKWSDRYDPILYDNMVFTYITGADEGTYIACLSQADGTLMYQPFEENYNYIYDHFIFTWFNDGVCVIDLLNGEVIRTLSELGTSDLYDGMIYHDQGLFVIKDFDYDQDRYIYLLYDAQGNEIQPILVG